MPPRPLVMHRLSYWVHNSCDPATTYNIQKVINNVSDSCWASLAQIHGRYKIIQFTNLHNE